jgi:alkylhydroperoxidase/carboxymuconolactone decarboxylase family protein YurZ
MSNRTPLDEATLERIRQGKGVAGMLETINPELTGPYMEVRQWALRREADSLPFKYKELLLSVMAIIMDADESAVGHAKKAVEEGLTIRELEETIVLILLIAGMTPVIKLGKRVLDEARETARQGSAPA